MEASRRVLTVPNLLSLFRILMIPVFVWLLAQEGREAWGLALLVLVVSTDWVDGYIARRTGRVTEVGKVLDPVADRLAIAAALVALVVQDAFPLWAALIVLVRDGLVLLVMGVLMATGRKLIPVRWLGKVATFTLMTGIPLVAWGNFGLAWADVALIAGWIIFALGAVEYYAAAFLYARDLIRASRQDLS
ncbi:MAG: CDP-alcohol phosphatidyltransferase family protein [Actinomycetota bacterium]